MKQTIILLLCTVLAGCCNNKQQPAQLPQVTEADIVIAIKQLVNGMEKADEKILDAILAKELVYGHSSGKVQNKSEFISEIRSGDPLRYIRIEPLEQTIQLAGNIAIVRHIFTAETRNTEGEPGNLRIGNMLIWQIQDGQWKLLARQAYRL